ACTTPANAIVNSAQVVAAPAWWSTPLDSGVMTSETGDDQRVGSQPQVAARPPEVRRVPSERVHHGDTFVDEYAWLADKTNPETIAYLEAQNAYTEALTAGQAGLRDEIFGEIKARTQETDLSVPARKGSWWYYSRTVEGQQYALHCRRPVTPGEPGPPAAPAEGEQAEGEEVLIDG